MCRSTARTVFLDPGVHRPKGRRMRLISQTPSQLWNAAKVTRCIQSTKVLTEIKTFLSFVGNHTLKMDVMGHPPAREHGCVGCFHQYQHRALIFVAVATRIWLYTLPPPYRQLDISSISRATCVLHALWEVPLVLSNLRSAARLCMIQSWHLLPFLRLCGRR
jgi:hypothetical protein